MPRRSRTAAAARDPAPRTTIAPCPAALRQAPHLSSQGCTRTDPAARRDRCTGRPCPREVESALLHPSVPRVLANAIRVGERVMFLFEDLDGRRLVGDPIAADKRRVRPVLRLVELGGLVVLDDQR